MIISASRRSDIPCYFSDWFFNRLNAGYVLSRNPMNHSQVSKISLLPQDVDCFVFWTKDPENMMNGLGALDKAVYNYYFQFTLNPYGADIERNLRDKKGIISTFIKLSETLSPERVLWRYDPIIINPSCDVYWHKEQFLHMCETLSPHTKQVTISFADNYRKLKNGIIDTVSAEAIEELSVFFGKTAKEHSLKAVACCEPYDLTRFGIEQASCIDASLIEHLCAKPLKLKRDKNQREACGCCGSVDIGAYNTCLNGCVYCYANYSEASIKRNLSAHDPNGELLIGAIGDNDIIKERKS